MSKSFAEDFQNSQFSKMGEAMLPEELSARFTVLERLAENDCGETFLLSEKSGSKWFVLKRYPKSSAMYENSEAKLLRELCHKGLPKFEAEIETEDALFVLREYAKGVPLDIYIAERGKIDEAQAIHIVMELCGILTYLHSRSAPIIHRDIKPSNIVIDSRGNNITLIDFGISRRYSENADADTACFGTKKFSPPEQYGFAQTDCRADIYAMGVVLRYMLTGKTDEAVKNKRLERIIEKCSAFSPKDRFPNAEAVKRALIKYEKGAGRKRALVAASITALCLVFAAGFIMGRNVGLLNSLPEKDLGEDTAVFGEQPEASSGEATSVISEQPMGVSGESVFVFSEPLVEKAVRIVLDKNNGEPIYIDDLNSITSLYFVGENAAASLDDYFALNDAFWTNSAQPDLGTLADLSDLTFMKNLQEVWICGQPLSDLSPLAACSQLTFVEILFCDNLSDVSPMADCRELIYIRIARCGVSDVSCLSGLTKLKIFRLVGEPVTDFSCFENMKSLRELEVIQLPVKQVSELGDVFQLETLSLRGTQIDSLSGIEEFAALSVLTLSGTGVRDFSLLNKLPALNTLTISADMEQYLDTLSRDDIRVTYLN